MTDEKNKEYKEYQDEKREDSAEEEAEAKDAQENKGLGIVAYIIFFVPLIIAKDSPFATYHANQGLLLLITAFVINVLGSIIPIIGWLFILPLGNLFIFILWLIGILNAAKGLKSPLPLVGTVEIIKPPKS
ncbi:hypothetical protein [Alkalibacillus silvisoli]|uniref:DUF4870 domain-containing protein n=1 Tax=Alkalibacillus silvisoli TaxID=392823 RepID=A0ABP3JVI5_9BACI